MKLSEKKIHNIIKETIKDFLLNEYNYQPKKKIILKKVKKNNIIVTAFFYKGSSDMNVEWNEENAPITYQRNEWLSHVKGNLYSTYTEWNELDFALDALGVKRVKSKQYIDDYGNHDTDIFTNTLYDFSSVINGKTNG